MRPKPQLSHEAAAATKETIIPALMGVSPLPAIHTSTFLTGGDRARQWPVTRIRIICMAKATIP